MTIGSVEENTWLTDTFKDVHTQGKEGNPNPTIPNGGCLAWIGYELVDSAWVWDNGESVTFTNHAAIWDNHTGIHAYLHLGNHNQPGTWNHNQLHEDPGSDQPKGIIERDTLDGKIPTVSEWGMGTMLLLLLVAGTIVVTKRRAEIAA